jgi:hypothetical protein
MLDALTSLSLTSGALVVAAVSAALAVGLARVSSVKARWSLGLLVPFAASYSLYWLPVWMGADPSEYSAWALLFVGPWSVAGVLASSVVLYWVGKPRGQAE